VYDRYLVVDTETTGLDPTKDKLVELAVVWREKNELKSFSSLLDPEIAIPPEVSAIHHITNKHLVNAPTLERLLDTWEFPEGVVVAHNIKFDKEFLPVLNNRLWLCTYRCALHLWLDAPAHTNMVLRYWLDLEVDLPGDLAPHRALYDVLVTNALLERMLKSRTLQELYHLQNKPVLLHKVKFGKHRNQLWKDLPKDYMQWILRQTGDNVFDGDVLHTCKHYLGMVT
jgi:exodeoxyribonuclease X